MRKTEQERKDLVVLVADSHQEQTVTTLLIERWKALGIRQLVSNADFDIYSLRNDPGVFKEAGSFLSIFAQQYEHALVLIDVKWEGGPANAEKIKKKIQDDLNINGWKGQSAVIAIDPELESWVWSTSSHVSGIVGMDREKIKVLGNQKGYWQAGQTKPSRPKELLKEVLHRTETKYSRALYGQLARKVSLRRCQDSSFRYFREVLQGWFPA